MAAYLEASNRAPYRFLDGGGEMGDRIRQRDWSAGSLGPIEAWPASLTTLVQVMLGSAQPMFIAWGAERAWLYNDAFIPILGRKHPWALGEPTSEVWAEAWDVMGPMFSQVFAGKGIYHSEFAVAIDRHGSLEEAHFAFSHNPVADSEGQVVGVFGVSTETTGNARSQAVLRESETRLRFLDGLGRATAELRDADELLATTTRMVGEHLGISNCAYADMDPDEDGFTIRGDWAAPGSPSIVGHYSLAAFGKLAVSRLSAGLPLIINDNLAELAPEEAATFQNIGIAATICMPLVKEGRLTALMAIHDKLPHVWSANELALIRDVTDRSWAHVERVGVEAELRASAEALSVLNATLEQRVQEQTSQRLRAEDALRQAQKMEAVGQLTGGIAHDFNNLLAGISGSFELIERRLAEGRLVDIHRYLATGQNAARRAASLTQRLLAFSRRQTLDPRPTDVKRLVFGLEELISRSVGPDVQLVIEAGDELWTIKVDPSQLESAILNLSINSRDAMAPAGGRLTISAVNERIEPGQSDPAGLPDGDYVRLCVEDTGAGMAPEILARIFDPFFTTKPLGQGTGLGLSMVYGFVRQSGGQVRAESQPGQGARLCLYLPKHAGPADAPLAVSPVRIDRGTGETVLVIDDEPSIRTLMVDALQESGYAVMEAHDGPSALRILQSDAPIDLLVTDVGLPGGMNGRQVADAARVQRPTLKVLFVTGFADAAAVGDGLLDVGMEVITKPFAISELGNRVSAMLARSGRA